MKKVRLFLMMLMVAMLPLAMQAQQALPYTYGFEDNDLTADGWTIVNGASGYSSGTGISTNSAMNGTYGFMFYYSTNPPQYLISPELTGTESGVELEFYYRCYMDYYDETFMVGYSTTDNQTSSFTWGEEILAPEEWTLYSDMFPAGTKYIAIAYTANDQYYLFLDDFSFAAPASCAKPTSMTATGITTTSAIIGWTDNNSTTPSSWTIDVNGTEITNVTENPYTIENLTAATEYTVKVKAACTGVDTSDWSNSITFATECEIINVTEATPYQESFDGVSFPPTCWTVAHTAGTASFTWVRNTSMAHSGDGCAQLEDQQAGNKNNLVTGHLNIPETNAYQVNFWVYRSSNYSDKQNEGVKVWINTTPDTVGATEIIYIHRVYSLTPAESATGWYPYTASIPTSGDLYVIFEGISEWGASTYIDDISVEIIPSCLAPTALTLDANSVTAYEATIGWTDNNNTTPENGWVLLVNDEEVPADANPFTLTNLTPETEYTVRAKAACSATDSSAWSNGSVSFTTLPSCLAPTALTVVENSVTATSAQISWTAGGEEEAWIISYNNTEITVTENPYTLEDLTPATIYTVEVAASCSETDTSHWSNTVSFTTECVTVVVTEENPFIEKFNNNGICWIPNDYVEGTTSWQVVSTISNGGSVTSLYDGACAKFYSSTSTQKTRAISPVMDLTALTNARLTFQMANAAWGSDVDRLKIYYRVAEDAEWIEIDSIGDAHAEWTPMTYSLPVTSATFQLAFEGSNNTGYNYGYAIFIDDVTVEETPDCLAPTALTLDTVTTTYFQVSWNDNNETTPASWTVAYSIDGGENFIEITGIDHDSAVVCNFEAPLGDVNVIAKVKANCDAEAESAWSNEINFVTPPTCPAPTALEYSDVTSSSVTLSWTAGGEETEWILELNGNENIVSENPVTIDTLTANTPYVVHVRALCGVSDTSVWNSGFTGFVTPCEALTAEGYTEDFSGYTASTGISSSNGVMPDCWNYIGTNGNYRPHVYNGTYSPTASDNCLVMTSGIASYGGNTNIAVMPVFDDLTGKQISFATAMESETSGTLSVGYVTDLNADSFVELEVIPNNGYNGTNRYATHEVIVSGIPAGSRIAFKWYQASSWYSCTIDDIAIEDMPACVAPMDVTAADSTLTATTATISWIDNNLTTPASWIVRLNGTDTTVTENPFTFDNLIPETEYIVMVMAACNESDSSEWSSEITFTTLPSCAAPVDITVTGITVNTATIAWTDRNETTPENGWIINLNGVDTLVSENPFTFDNLASSNTYSVKVAANCSETDTSDWSATANFATPCETIVVTDDSPFSEDFNTLTSGIPACWDNEEGTTTYNPYKWNYYATGATGAGLRFNSWTNSTGNTNMLKTPVMDVTEVTNPMLSFNYKNPTGGDFSVFVSTDGGATYTTSLATGLTGVSDWTMMEIALENLAATNQVVIVFAGTSNYGTGDAYIYLDDVTVGKTPTCQRPTDVTIDNVTTTTATISWTDNNIEAPQGWTISLNGVDTTVSENPFTFDNLVPSTLYTVKVKANCTDDDESDWSAEAMFSTDCETVVVTEAVPYHEGFENSGICWSVEQIAGGYDWWVEEDGDAAYEGTHVAIAPYQPGAQTRLISPVLDLSQLTNPELSFYHLQESYEDWYGNLNIDEMSVYYRTSENDAWTELATYSTEYAEYTMETMALPNPTATYQISFVAIGHDGYNVLLDDINIVEGTEQPCATPTNVTVENGVVTWTGDAANYNVVITVGEDTVVNTSVNTNSYTIEGLNEGDHATVTVQAVCSEDDLSEWSEAVEFDYTVGVNNYSIKANIYPNPTTGNVTVESNAINADINVYDMFGKLMMTSKVAAERTELNFSSFAPGVYMVRIANTTGTTNIKVVKE